MSSVQTIRFCPQCDNKYYHSISDDDLLYFCRICKHQDKSIKNRGLCVLETEFRMDSNSNSYENMIHKYTKYDPTLPRLHISCPNEQCKTNLEHKGESEIIYLRYDDKKMLYLYRCMTCDYTWKTNS